MDEENDEDEEKGYSRKKQELNLKRKNSINNIANSKNIDRGEVIDTLELALSINQKERQSLFLPLAKLNDESIAELIRELESDE